MTGPPATAPAKPSVMLAALRGRCPNCGRGALFDGFLRIKPACEVCRTDFSAADTGDGPAVFVMFPVGAAAVVTAIILEFGFGAPPLATIVVTFALTIALSLLLLRPFKAALFALQWRLKAEEGRADERRADERRAGD